jgi:hypothetical protein
MGKNMTMTGMAILMLTVSVLLTQCGHKKPEVKETEPAAQTEPSKTGGSNCGCTQAKADPAQPDPDQGSTAPKVKPDLVKVIILLNKGDQSSFKDVENKIKGLGGRVTTSMLPAGLYALVPADKETGLKAVEEIKVASSKAIDPVKVKGLSDLQKAMLKDWNNSVNNTREPTLIPNPPPPPGDARTRPKPKSDPEKKK